MYRTPPPPVAPSPTSVYLSHHHKQDVASLLRLCPHQHSANYQHKNITLTRSMDLPTDGCNRYDRVSGRRSSTSETSWRRRARSSPRGRTPRSHASPTIQTPRGNFERHLEKRGRGRGEREERRVLDSCDHPRGVGEGGQRGRGRRALVWPRFAARSTAAAGANRCLLKMSTATMIVRLRS